MRMMTCAILAAALAVAGCAGTKSTSKAPPPPPTEAQQAAEMAAWMAYMTPGEAHIRMAGEVGEWTAAGKMWMAPGTDPMETTGSATISMINGGLHQKMDYSSEFMGMPMVGMGITGFDNQTKEYTSTWVDSMGSGTMVSRGKYVDKGRMELTGEGPDLMGGMMKYRQVMISATDTMVMEMYLTHEKYGGEFKMMVLTFTRKR